MHIIFDLDGTLIDSRSSVLRTYEEVLLSLQLSAKAGVGENVLGPSLDDAIEILIPDASRAIKADFKKKYIEKYDAKNYKLIKPFQGINELIRQIYADGHKLYIVTNKRSTIVRKILEDFEWISILEKVIAKDSKTPAYLNKEEMLLELIGEFTDQKARIMYLGDTEEDQTAAEACGINFVYAAWGWRENDTKAPQDTSVIVRKVDECLKCFGTHN